MNRETDPATRNRNKAMATRRILLSLLLLQALFCGCATHRCGNSGATSRFDFSRDTLAFANELTWDYGFDEKGEWTAHTREPKPDYTLHCFVVVRSAEQFFRSARFDPQRPVADEATYRKLIRKIVSSNPRKQMPESRRVVVPGYADLRSFSAAHEQLLKQECGSAFDSYIQRGHWRMVFPFSRREQEKMADQLLEAVNREGIAVVHVLRFPSLTINHALLLFEAQTGTNSLKFSAYDPNDPTKPLKLEFDRQRRSFVLPPTHYYPGGEVNAYQVYHRWNY